MKHGLKALNKGVVFHQYDRRLLHIDRMEIEFSSLRCRSNEEGFISITADVSSLSLSPGAYFM
jgi:hypothetical protein